MSEFITLQTLYIAVSVRYRMCRSDFNDVFTSKETFKLREIRAGLIEVRIEDGQRWGWQLSIDISDGTQGMAQIRPHPTPTGDIERQASDTKHSPRNRLGETVELYLHKKTQAHPVL